MSLRRLLSVGVALAALITPSLAAAAPVIDFRDKPRPAVSDSPCPSWDPQVLKPGDDVHVGSIKRSRCHIAYLRDFAAADSTDWREVRVTTRELARLYEARSGRQQAWIDDVGVGAGGEQPLGEAPPPALLDQLEEAGLEMVADLLPRHVERRRQAGGRARRLEFGQQPATDRREGGPHAVGVADLAAIAEGVIARTLPKSAWTHAAHFACAVWIVMR
eukprot:gene20050-19954_t